MLCDYERVPISTEPIFIIKNISLLDEIAQINKKTSGYGSGRFEKWYAFIASFI